MYEHLDGSLSVGYGPHMVAQYDSEAKPVVVNKVKTRGKNKNQKQLTNRTIDLLQKADTLMC